MMAHQENKVSGHCDATSFFPSLFSGQDADLRGWSPSHSYPAGVRLYQQNDPVTHIYFIESGIIKLSYICPTGKELIICLRRSNWLLGVTHVCVGEEVYSATARTLTPCSLRSIPARTFADQLAADAALSCELNRMLSNEIRENTRKIITLGSLTATERLRRFLCELISEEDPGRLGKDGMFELPVNGEELAEIVAVTPQHLYRLLKDPSLSPHMKKGKRNLIVINPLVLLQGDAADG